MTDDQVARGVPVVVALPVEIDVTNCDQVHDQLIAALEPGVGIVVADLTSTVFCDSSGVHAIMRAHERATARGGSTSQAVSSNACAKASINGLAGASCAFALSSIGIGRGAT